MELQISAIKNGTVIDHLPTDTALKVVEILDLKNFRETVTVAFNLTSNSLGKKGIVKVDARNLTEEELEKISIIAPGATINIIKDFHVQEKKEVPVPKRIIGLMRCNNNRCITNSESVKTKFLNESNTKERKYRCVYCEKVIKYTDIILK